MGRDRQGWELQAEFTGKEAVGPGMDFKVPGLGGTWGTPWGGLGISVREVGASLPHSGHLLALSWCGGSSGPARASPAPRGRGDLVR